MPRQIITTPNAPSSALYSQGVKAGPFVFVSGIVGIDPSSGSLAGETIQDQTRQALTNCEAILKAGGASLDDVIEVGVLLTRPADFAGLNDEYARWFPSEPPTRYVAKLRGRTNRPTRLNPHDCLHRLSGNRDDYPMHAKARATLAEGRSLSDLARKAMKQYLAARERGPVASRGGARKHRASSASKRV